MNLTCSNCQTPFTLGMAEKVAALQKMHAEDLHHYDAHCPRCGRANAVSRERLEMFTPGWQEAIQEKAPESAPIHPAEPMTSLPPAQEPTQAQMPLASTPVMPAPVKTPAKPVARKPAAKKHPVKPKKAAAKKPAKKVAKAKPKPKPKKAVKKTAAKKKSKRK